MIIIDGSEGEGGGQIIRNAISYATILQVPIKVHSIRAKRTKPGLKAQHKTALRLAVDICGGTLHGVEIGSDYIEYYPEKNGLLNDHSNEEEEAPSIHAKTGTAGSICLLLQVALPCALFSRNKHCKLLSMCLEGGTNATLAPQIDYFTEILLPIMANNFLKVAGNDGCDGELEIEIEKRGYFPQGGGVVKCLIPQLIHNTRQPLNPIILTEKGKLSYVHIKSFHGGKLPRIVAKEIADAAHKHIKDNSSSIPELSEIKISVEIVKHTDARGSGSGIIIVAKTSTNCIFGASAVGNKKIKPKDTGKEAATELIDSLLSGGCVDDWLSDQLILFMALAQGVSKVLVGGLTLHTQSAIDVASLMTDAEFKTEKIDQDDHSVYCPLSNTYQSDGRVNGRHIITCRGAGILQRME